MTRIEGKHPRKPWLRYQCDTKGCGAWFFSPPLPEGPGSVGHYCADCSGDRVKQLPGNTAASHADIQYHGDYYKP